MDARWTPQAGDQVFVDTQISIVYLVHADGRYIALDALTGQHRIVWYDGIRYNAETPERVWQLKSFEQKGKSVTFGNGRFGRLWWADHIDPRRGDEGTAYGFHSHASFEKMLSDKHNRTAWDPEGTGYRSMGCILLSEDDLSLLESTLIANEGMLRIETRKGINIHAISAELSEKSNRAPEWFGFSL